MVGYYLTAEDSAESRASKTIEPKIFIVPFPFLLILLFNSDVAVLYERVDLLSVLFCRAEDKEVC